MTKLILKNRKKWGIVACILAFSILVSYTPVQAESYKNSYEKKVTKTQTQLYNLIDDVGVDKTQSILKYGINAADKYGVATAKKKMAAKYGTETAKQAFSILSFFQWAPIVLKIIKAISGNGGDITNSLSSFINSDFLDKLFSLIGGGSDSSNKIPTPSTK